MCSQTHTTVGVRLRGKDGLRCGSHAQPVRLRRALLHLPSELLANPFRKDGPVEVHSLPISTSEKRHRLTRQDDAHLASLSRQLEIDRGVVLEDEGRRSAGRELDLPALRGALRWRDETLQEIGLCEYDNTNRPDA